MDNEEKLATVEQTQMQHAYTYWVQIKEQGKNKWQKDANFDDQLKEIETVNTVSKNWFYLILLFVFILIG